MGRGSSTMPAAVGTRTDTPASSAVASTRQRSPSNSPLARHWPHGPICHSTLGNGRNGCPSAPRSASVPQSDHRDVLLADDGHRPPPARHRQRDYARIRPARVALHPKPARRELIAPILLRIHDRVVEVVALAAPADVAARPAVRHQHLVVRIEDGTAASQPAVEYCRSPSPPQPSSGVTSYDQLASAYTPWWRVEVNWKPSSTNRANGAGEDGLQRYAARRVAERERVLVEAIKPSAGDVRSTRVSSGPRICTPTPCRRRRPREDQKSSR